MKFLLSIALLVPILLHAQPANYVFDGIWTGNNNFSSAPLPTCHFDIDPNTAESPAGIDGDNQLPEICYDEFIPEGSRGWVHAMIYRKSSSSKRP